MERGNNLSLLIEAVKEKFRKLHHLAEEKLSISQTYSNSGQE